ncbi:MAG: hypothetical protein P4L42_16560 [Desulfocapsaceae bacterium]|nr:hypothetical protein [Desulfocapsaceae bacterium]
MRILFWTGILLLVTVLQGCSGQHWYDGFQMVRESQCSKAGASDAQHDDCLNNADIHYSQYNKDIQGAANKP